MAEREVVMEEQVIDRSNLELRAAVERAERAEAQLAKLRGEVSEIETMVPRAGAHALHDPSLTGTDALHQDPMMSHLLDALSNRKDIGHYGRLVFAMVARHFLSEEEMVIELTKDPDFNEEQAIVMLRQVGERDYSPPRRERILEWQLEQEFQILPSMSDPDCGNVYRSLHFSTSTYKHIEEYQEERATAAG
jgi:hypothetical protein